MDLAVCAVFIWRVMTDRQWFVNYIRLCFVLQNSEAWFLIDSERFELMNIRCRLLPAKLRVFAADSFSVPLNTAAVVHKQ